MALPSFVQSGVAGLTSGNNKFIRLESGKPIEIIPLTGIDAPAGEAPNGRNSIISFRQYTAWLDNPKEGQFSPSFPAIGGEGDPGAMLGLEAKFRGMMLCVQRGEEDTEKIFAFGVSVFKQLVDAEAALGESIKGRVFRVLKKGEGKMTKYTVTNTGRMVEIDGEPETSLLDHLGPTTRPEIIKALEEVDLWPPEGGDPYATVLTKAKAKVKEVDEDEDDDELEEEPAPKSPAKKKSAAPADPVTPPAKKDDDEEDWAEEEFEKPAKKAKVAKS